MDCDWGAAEKKNFPTIGIYFPWIFHKLIKQPREADVQPTVSVTPHGHLLPSLASARELRREAVEWLRTPWKINGWNTNMEVDGSDDFPFQMGDF